MATTLVATASVHTTAAACDYLGPRLGPDDRVVVLAVTTPAVGERDAGDATNVARTRLPGVDVETRLEPAGDQPPATVIRAVADEVDAADIVCGARRGDPEGAGDPPGNTVRALLAAADRPVVVVPLSDLG